MKTHPPITMEQLEQCNKLHGVVNKYARIAYKKLRKPTIYTLEDITQDGMFVLYEVIHYYKKHSKASFKTFLIRCLINYYVTDLVQYSYNKNLHTAVDFEFINYRQSKSAITPIQNAVLKDKISSLKDDEKEYIYTVLELPEHVKTELTITPGRRQKRVLREFVCAKLKINEDREREIRKSIKAVLTN